MAPVRRAWVLAGVLLSAAGAWSSDMVTPTPDRVPSAPYTLSYDKDTGPDRVSVFHMSVTDELGVFSSSVAASSDPKRRPLTRLDSAWSLTAPLLALPIRLGDNVSSAALWDRPARMGGLQIGSDHLAAPDAPPPAGFVAPADPTRPDTLMSTRFTDHSRTMLQFQRQTLATRGQGDFSLESRRLREDFEARSNAYGPWLTSGTYRYGLGTATTLDGEVAQVSGQQSILGVGVLEGLGPLGLVSARVATSREPDASGWVARMGYDFNHDHFSIALRSHIQSAAYQDVGDLSTIEPLRQRTLASARLDLGSLGRLSLASATQNTTDDSRRDLIALSHALPFGGGGIVSTAAAYSPGPLGNSAVLLSFTYPFDYFAASAHHLNGAMDGALDRTIVDAFGQTKIPVSGQVPQQPVRAAAP